MIFNWKNAIAVTVITTLTLTQISLPVMADDDPESISGGAVVSVVDEGEPIGTNAGTVCDNLGTITDNQGTVIVNDKRENDESPITGEVTTNAGSGTVVVNMGKITTNNGTVGITNATAFEGGNYGSIDTNNGTVTLNAGEEDNDISGLETTTYRTDYAENWAGLPDIELPDSYSGAVIDANNGVVNTNDGTINDNSTSGVITVNNGFVGTNHGIVNKNTGRINDNEGTVYNYDNGNVITNKSQGVVYFSVDIKSSNNSSLDYGDGFTDHDNFKWLGTTGTTQNTSTITITPSDGYKITSLDNLPVGVSAAQNPNGSWTLTVLSGQNITFTIPDASKINNTTNNSNPPEVIITAEPEPDDSVNRISASTTIDAQIVENQKKRETQLSEAHTLFKKYLEASPAQKARIARNGLDLNFSHVEILDPDMVYLLVYNNKNISYNITMLFGGYEINVRIPKGFDFKPFIRVDGTININDLLWYILTNS